MSKKQSSKPKAAKAAKTEAPAAATAETPAAPAAVEATPEAQSAPAVEAKPAAEKKAAAEKKSAAKTLRVRRGSLIVGKGELRKIGETIRSGELSAAEAEKYLADGTLELS